MRDKSKQLLVINTGKKKSEQTGMPSQSGTTHIIGGGGLSVNMSDYLLKSIWDKVFEIRTDSQGIEYIFGKLPMVTQYGITMYSGDGVDIPSLASGLPFDGRTIWYNPDTQQIEVIGGTGGGSGEGVSNFWDLSGIPSWITNSKPKYTYSEIEGTPDLTKYALVSQIPSLSGYATESWVNQQNYAIKATTLSGYGITDAYTKTNVDDLLMSYVTLSGSQTITGEKNFTGGLKVNGSPIYYDTEKKYWKLEGDLLVTGGVTMYGSDSSFTPSTIMDAIAVDGTTISKDGGILKVIGGTGGGVADSVSWANITGKPTWIGSSKPSYSYSEITGAISTTELQNYLTQNSYLNVTSGDNRYLKLSGGTINGAWALDIKRSDGNYASLITFSNTSGILGYVGFTPDKRLAAWSDLNLSEYTIWHSGNDGSGSGLDADMLDGYHVTHFMSYIKGSGYVQANLLNSELWNVAGGDGYIEYYDNDTWFNSKWGRVLAHYGFDGDLRGNASSATKLQTARTIWGQSFDGTGNIEGVLYNVGAILGGINGLNISTHPLYVHLDVGVTFVNKTNQQYLGEISYYKDHFIVGNYKNERENSAISLYDNGDIVFDGNGRFMLNRSVIYINDANKSNATPLSYWGLYSWNNTFSITTRKDSSGDYLKGIVDFDVNGNVLAYGGITMYSDQRKKTILNHVELSLKQIADAPLIEHYYNSDDKKTTHVGSIAQYWASMNDWFCKLDSEGYFTMEIQNAALASAISIARELDRYETKTDKAINKLKKRICELEEEVERLKSA